MEVISEEAGRKRRRISAADEKSFIDELDRYQIQKKTAKQRLISNFDLFYKEGRIRSYQDLLSGEFRHYSIQSPYTGARLKPFIWQDHSARPLKLKVLLQVTAAHNLFMEDWMPESVSVDYSYMRPEHTDQVNGLLNASFWPGIDVEECLTYPDFTICAMYKKMVVGCALMTPDGYISYIVVHPDWRGAGIASFMIYHLIQTRPDCDITLHVSVSNTAMILYQKFGFKPEEFIVGFYKRYYPDVSKECKNAFFLRLKR